MENYSEYFDREYLRLTQREESRTNRWSTLFRALNKASSIGIFVCLCKILNNLTRKIEHPFLLEKGWMITLTVFFCMVFLINIISHTYDLLKTLREQERSELSISLFKTISTVFVSFIFTFVPATIIILYLGGKASQKVVEKTLQVYTWLNIAFAALVLLVLTFNCISSYSSIRARRPRFEEVDRTILNIALERNFPATRGIVPNENIIPAIDPVHDVLNIHPEAQATMGRYINSKNIAEIKIDFIGILEHSGDFEYMDIKDNVQLLTPEKLERLFRALANRLIDEHFEATTSHFLNIINQGMSIKIQEIFLDCIFEVLEGPKSVNDGRTTESDNISKVFHDFLKKYGNNFGIENKNRNALETTEIKNRMKSKILGVRIENLNSLGNNPGAEPFHISSRNANRFEILNAILARYETRTSASSSFSD